MRTLQYAALAAIATATVLVTASATPAAAQAAYAGQHIGALAQENLNMRRPKAPFDLTGTWNMVIDQKTGGANFLPLPKLTTAGQAVFDKTAAERAAGRFRDDSGACWPLGMPYMMTRFWPTSIIQLPTVIQIITMFDNSVRWVYMDGRPHPNEDEMVLTYNGHSTGKWEGDTLVIDTVGMTDDHHWAQAGVPASTKLHVVERIKLVDGGKAFEDEFTMTDPDNWVGEWKNTKKFLREDRTDIEEHVCIYEQMKSLPSFKYNIRE